MFDDLSNLGYGIITFAVIIGVGVIILQKFATGVAGCATTHTYNSTDGYCYNSTGGDQLSASQGAQNTFYLEGQLGQTGLAGWTPAIIALSVGMLFLGVFVARSGRKV